MHTASGNSRVSIAQSRKLLPQRWRWLWLARNRGVSIAQSRKLLPQPQQFYGTTMKNSFNRSVAKAPASTQFRLASLTSHSNAFQSLSRESSCLNLDATASTIIVSKFQSLSRESSCLNYLLASNNMLAGRVSIAQSRKLLPQLPNFGPDIRWFADVSIAQSRKLLPQLHVPREAPGGLHARFNRSVAKAPASTQKSQPRHYQRVTCFNRSVAKAPASTNF